MPLDLRCWQVRQKKKKKNTIRTFHTCREGSQRFMLPATCPRGCLLSRDLRRSRVWSADDEKTSLEEVCGRGVFVAGTLGSKGGGCTEEWVGMEQLWGAGSDSESPAWRSCEWWRKRRLCKWAPSGFFLPPVHLAAVLHSLQTCPELFEPCAVISTVLGDREKPCCSRHTGDTVGMSVPTLLQKH